MITNRTVKPFIEVVDLFPGFKLEEECFSKAVISDPDQPSRKKKKSDVEEPMSWPRQKPIKQTSYENFLEEVINSKTGTYYPQKDQDGRAIPKTGLTLYITDVIRIRRADGSKYLYTKGRADAWNSLGDPVSHSISMPEKWTRTNFSSKTEYNNKTKEFEKVLQGPSGSEEVYTLPFTKENLKQLYDRRENDLLNFTVKLEQTKEAHQVKDVTENPLKSYELFRDKDFNYLFAGDYVPPAIKEEMRQRTIAEGLIGGTMSDFHPPSTNANKTNTYQ